MFSVDHFSCALAAWSRNSRSHWFNACALSAQAHGSHSMTFDAGIKECLRDKASKASCFQKILQAQAGDRSKIFKNAHLMFHIRLLRNGLRQPGWQKSSNESISCTGGINDSLDANHLIKIKKAGAPIQNQKFEGLCVKSDLPTRGWSAWQAHRQRAYCADTLCIHEPLE